jgi:diketogulonate reductase-like aldo/keto reductase
MKRDKLVESLAVSNFSPEQLDSIYIYKDATTQPTVNQLPYSIANHPKNMIEYNRERGILVQSWSPLSTTLPKYKAILETIGKKYGKTAAQVALRWIIQTGASFCMQSKSQKHFEENLNVFDFSLTDREIYQLSQLQPPPLLDM